MNDDNDWPSEPERLPDTDGLVELPPEPMGDASIWGVPALLTDSGQPAATPVAALILFFPHDELEVDPELAADSQLAVGPELVAEPIDPIATGYLRRGFDLVTSLEVATLGALPDAPGWQAALASATRTLRITDDDGTVITGPVDVLVPPDWYRALTERASLVVLVAGPLELGDSVMASLDQTRLAGRLVGASIPLGR